MNPGDVAQSVLPLTSSDLSLFALFWQAHWIVKSVMIGLLVASVWVWAIVIDKIMLYTRTRRAMDRFEQAFWSGQSLEELYRTLSARPTHSMAALFVAAMREWKRSFESQARSFAGLQTRIEKVMDVTIAREIERLERRLLVLATVGSAGPFIGLFGTVWGIMTSFQSIAASKNTSLAVVAPGIAEALFATAIGLIAAIPATIFYNKFISEVNRQAQRLEGFADEFSAILSRQIDERGVRESGMAHERSGGGCAFGGVGKRRHRRSPVMSEINVTPMVDVMLVLLIIFMVSAPLLTVGVPIDLPQTPGQEPRPGRQGAADDLGQHQGPGLPAEYRDRDRRTGAQAQGHHRGARRQRRAHLCARRQQRGLWYGDEGDGTAVRRRLPPGRAGDGGGAGFVKLPEMKTGLTISALVARRPAAVGADLVLGAAAGGRADGCAAGRHHLRQGVLRAHRGVKNAPKADEPKPLVEKIGEPKPVEDPSAKVAEKKEIKAAKAAAEPPPPPLPEPKPAEAKPEKKRAAEGRSDRRGAEEGGGEEEGRGEGQGEGSKAQARAAAAQVRSQPRSRRCSTSAIRSGRPRPARR